MANCSFCGNTLKAGTGITLYKRTGATVHYCSRKCRRNLQMGRSAEKAKWTHPKKPK